MAQLVEHILGKDEVAGSIPASSSKKATFRVAFFIQADGQRLGMESTRVRVEWHHGFGVYGISHTAVLSA